MPKLLNSLPKYRRHSSRNLAFVVVNGRRRYLPGRYGSSESRKEYRRLCLEWEVEGRPTTTLPSANEITVMELLEAYWKFAEKHYRMNGEPTGELDNIAHALSPVKKLYGHTDVREFGPLALKALQAQMVRDAFMG